MSEDRPAEIELTRPDHVCTYDDVAQRVRVVKALLEQKRVQCRKNSALGNIFRHAEELAKSWAEGVQDNVPTVARVLAMGHASRIAEAILAVQEDAEAINCLKRMAGSDMNLSRRPQSQGKDALWELELLAFLRRHEVSADLVDPPDIIAHFAFGDYAIACKKIYSEKGVAAQIRKGCHQIRNTNLKGVVAINIDDLVPGEVILRSLTKTEAMNALSTFIDGFIESHRRTLQDAVFQERCDAIIVSVSSPADIIASTTRFNNVTQLAVWTLNETTHEVNSRLQHFRRIADSLG